MPETRGMPERSRWDTEDWSHPTRNPWAQEAIAQRGYSDWDMVATSAAEDPEADAPAGRKRSERSTAAVLAAIADALGVEVDDLPDEIDPNDALDILTHDLADPQEALDALDAALDHPEEKAAPGTSDRAYVVREGNWRERHGMPRKRNPNHVRPSRTREARRQRYLQGLVDAGKYPDIATAEREAPRRSRRDTRPASELPRDLVRAHNP